MQDLSPLLLPPASLILSVRCTSAEGRPADNPPSPMPFVLKSSKRLEYYISAHCNQSRLEEERRTEGWRPSILGVVLELRRM